MEERLKGLKRKRKDILDDNKGQDDDAFDIAVEDAISDKRPPAKRSRPEGDKKFSRQARDKKFGFGGHGRRAKQNTRVSTDDFDFGSRKGAGGGGKGKGGKGGGKGGGSKRPGKSRRMAARSR
ncbi:hypothetical protein MPER_13787 [Moniliophthora perniciosa FA553]|nr:hypothetical protein MPER_13787 [Moniliophthora perniciosa FA553]